MNIFGNRSIGLHTAVWLQAIVRERELGLPPTTQSAAEEASVALYTIREPYLYLLPLLCYCYQ